MLLERFRAIAIPKPIHQIIKAGIVPRTGGPRRKKGQKHGFGPAKGLESPETGDSCSTGGVLIFE
jgi:hypothetical protein